MHAIEKILRKYFTPDELEYRSISMKFRDYPWQSDHGYAVLVKDKPMGRHYERTKAGKKYFDKLTKRNNVLVERLINSDVDGDEASAKKEISKYLWKHEDCNVEKELSEDMYHAYLTLFVSV